MAEKKVVNVEALIQQFILELKKEIPVEKVYLFGSYAKGNPTKDSDIDLIVVSSSFKKGSYIRNMQYLFRKAAKINSLLEPIPATPEEVKNPDGRVFMGQVLKAARAYTF